MARQYQLARKMKHITVTKAAHDLGISQPSLSAWESERKTPSLESVIRMSEYYDVSIDFLLGFTDVPDRGINLLKDVSASALPALHNTPVYVPDRGWAFVDATQQQLHFADGKSCDFREVQRMQIRPSAFEVAAVPMEPPLKVSELKGLNSFWVEIISDDYLLRNELRGRYHLDGQYAINQAQNRLRLDWYGAKWLAFRDKFD